MNKLLIICGPTGTGKTALAVRLAKQYNGELISADSRQVYRGMDIGTGKDVNIELRIKNKELRVTERDIEYMIIPYNADGIPLWMYDVVDPDEEFSVSHYAFLASSVIADIQKRGKTPIIVGGTGLYIRSIIQPIETASIPPDPGLRKQLSAMTRVELQQKVQHEIPDVWARMNNSDRNNPRRLVRKLEIGQKFSTSSDKIFNSVDYLMIGLRAQYQVLYKRIDQRVDTRVEQGIVEEIQGLLDRGYTWDLPSMSALGYKEWKPFFEGANDKQLLKDTCIQQWKYDEHAYARRQMTWFRSQQGIRWFDVSAPDYEHEVTAYVSKWYTKPKL